MSTMSTIATSPSDPTVHPTPSPASFPILTSSSNPNSTSPSTTHTPNHTALPPLVTSPPVRRTNLPRPMSHASKNRLSQYSAGSVPARSRPVSHVYPIYPSSLPYALVRDFAYPASHPLHYGAPPESSRPSSTLMTPSIDAQTQPLYDEPPVYWDDSHGGWDGGSWSGGSFNRAGDIPPIYLGDGPPWSEDEDLQSPVVSSRHRKHKSVSSAYERSRYRATHELHGDGLGINGGHGAAGAGAGTNGTGTTTTTTTTTSNGIGTGGAFRAQNFDQDRGYYVGTSGDGSERYYSQEGDEANGPGGEYVTYPPDQARHSAHPYQLQAPSAYGPMSGASGVSGDADADVSLASPVGSPDFYEDDQSRYSRDYQFTITSPDEEMHGKAVALFDFERENENELPLVEGQIVLISYRHGQGWLVAMDPKTQESGLVPEEYVRLLRDIEGGMTSLTGAVMPATADGATSPNDGGTPTQAEHQGFTAGHTPTPSTASTVLAVAGTTAGAISSTGASTTGAVGSSGATGSSGTGYHQPIVSTFSTSSKDLDPYPQHLLGTQAGQTPPQVVHYHGQRGGSQANTPTLLSHQDAGLVRRGSQDLPPKKADGHVPSLDALVDESKMEAQP